MGYRISIYGDIYDVGLNFFQNADICRDEKVGDTHFITFAEGNGYTTFGIYFKEYERVKQDLRDSKIDGIFDSSDNIEGFSY